MPDKNVLHAASILAEYPDIEDDTTLDNQLVMDALVNEDTAVLIAKDDSEFEIVRENLLPHGPGYFLFAH